MDPRRALDTLAVVRAIGARGLVAAVWRTARSTARSMTRRSEDANRPLSPPERDRFTRALRVAPSPLAPGDDASRFAALERERPGATERIRERALAAALEPQRALVDDDPRLAWEPDRLARLVAIAAGTRAAASPSEARWLVDALERAAIAWIDRHPPSSWRSPLEIALRAWNLWVAVSLVGAGRLSHRAAEALAGSLVQHGRAIDDRLEERGLVVGTHLVGGLVGLYACGAALDLSGAEAERWRRRARAGLAAAATEQVLIDGGGAEASTGYARFAAELWIAAWVTARAVGEPIPVALEAAASSSLAHLCDIMTPAGTDPGIGDDDGSRVLPPAAGGAEVSALAPLRIALLGGVERLEGVPWSEPAAWIAGDAGFARWRASPIRPWSRRFDAPRFGLYGARRGGLGGDLVTMRAGGHGRAAGGHAHDDALSITVWLDGEPVVVDPGTGLYLGRRAWRDRFRGVAAHATVCVDGQEPSPILATRPFALPDRARAHATSVSEAGEVWWCEARHDGWRALGLAYAREVRFDRRRGEITIVERLERRGTRDREHVVTLSFPLLGSPEIVGDEVRVGRAWLRAMDPRPAWRLDPGAHSPRYGVIEPAWVARRVVRARAPMEITTVIGARRGS